MKASRANVQTYVLSKTRTSFHEPLRRIFQVMCIAHRLSTLRSADHILFFNTDDNGTGRVLSMCVVRSGHHLLPECMCLSFEAHYARVPGCCRLQESGAWDDLVNVPDGGFAAYVQEQVIRSGGARSE